jgi:radical SAM protein with 4Fe4S-binding SPASM domain
MIKVNPYSYFPAPLYSYLFKTYSKFLLSGECLGFPRVIQLQTHSRCNGQCEICPYRVTSKTLRHGNMEWGLYKKISDELAAEGKPPMLMLALHNEPLLEKGIFDYTKYVKSKNPECYCIIPTNGQLLGTFSLSEIKYSDVNQLNLNFGAFSKETYDRIYPGLNYETVKENIMRLVADDSLRKKLQIMFVVNSENAHEANQALKYWRQQGVRIKLVNLNNRAGSLDTYQKMKNAPFAGGLLLNNWKKITSNVRHITGCELPFYQMNILYNGDVIICSCDWKCATIIGNVYNNSLREIWNSDRINGIRRLILRRRYSQIPSCKDCSMVEMHSNHVKSTINLRENL